VRIARAEQCAIALAGQNGNHIQAELPAGQIRGAGSPDALEETKRAALYITIREEVP